MDYKMMSDTYRKLSKVSGTPADVLWSDEMGKILEDCQEGLREKSCPDLLQIQLARRGMREFLREFEERDFWALSAEERRKALIRHVLLKAIAHVPENERNSALIEMIRNTRELLKEDADETFLVQATQKTEEELRELLTDDLQKALGKFDRKSLWETVMTRTSQAELPYDKRYSAGAGAGAAYISDEALRSCPEMIGVSCACVETLTEKHNNVEEGPQSTAELLCDLSKMIAIMLLLFLLFLLGGSLFGAAISVLGTSLELHAAFSLQAVGAMFVEFLALFATEFKIAFGAATAIVLLDVAAGIAESVEIPKTLAAEVVPAVFDASVPDGLRTAEIHRPAEVADAERYIRRQALDSERIEA